MNRDDRAELEHYRQRDERMEREQADNFRRWRIRSEELYFAAKLLVDLDAPLTEEERMEWIEAMLAFTATYNPEPSFSTTTTAAREVLVHDRRPDGQFKRYAHWPLEPMGGYY